MGTKTGIEWTDATWWPMKETKQLLQPLSWRKPKRIFVNSMSDLFHENVPDEWIDQIFAVMALCPQHTFQVLTKRPERMRMYCSDDVRVGRISKAADEIAKQFGARAISETSQKDDGLHGIVLSNVWLGVSIENQNAADERIPQLLQTPAEVRFISAELSQGPIDLSCLPFPERMPHAVDEPSGEGFDALRFDDRNSLARLGHLDWVICGGESGPGARPMHPDWVRSLRDQCKAAGVPFFFKQWGEWEPSFNFSEQFKDVPPATPVLYLAKDGHIGHSFAEMEGHPRHGLMVRTGKKAAGSLLDGVEFKEFPTQEYKESGL